jgi:hypothetical protein
MLFKRLTIPTTKWNKMGNPDIGATIYYFNHKTKTKHYGKIEDIHYGRKGIKIGLRLFKHINYNNSN